MAILLLGLVIFLGLHSVRIVAEGGRAKAIARLGEGGWKGAYSILSVIGFVLIVWGFASARPEAAQLWIPPVWTRHITIFLMLISMILLGSYAFKASHIAVAVRHPMVWAVVVWSAAHLFANGSAADVLLFGAFFVWGVADLVSAYGREPRAAVLQANWGATAGAVLLGLAFWAVLIGGLHYWLFGVSPLGMSA